MTIAKAARRPNTSHFALGFRVLLLAGKLTMQQEVDHPLRSQGPGGVLRHPVQVITLLRGILTALKLNLDQLRGGGDRGVSCKRVGLRPVLRNSRNAS